MLAACARLEIVCGLIPHPGFKSLTLRVDPLRHFAVLSSIMRKFVHKQESNSAVSQ